jgi:ribose transport system ATP-binding protein
VQDVSFALQPGEILGIAGLVGAGRTEAARLIFGADRCKAGEIRVHEKIVKITSPGDAVKAGISYLSEDRKRFGMILGVDLTVNTILASMHRFTGKFGRWKRSDAEACCSTYLDKLRVKATGPRQRAENLSGGNQQKVIIGKWLLCDSDIIIFDEPTRGIDVGAKDEIYRLMDDLASQGKGIIMISSELPEILRMSHRILVMCEGKITGTFLAKDATQENIMHCAVQYDKGGHDEA